MSIEAPSGLKMKEKGCRLDVKNFSACVGRGGILEKTVDSFPEAVRHQQLPEKAVGMWGGEQGTEVPMSLVEVPAGGASPCVQVFWVAGGRRWHWCAGGL